MATTSIAKLNRPVTVKKYVFGQDDAGGNIKALTSSYDMLADVEMISNTYYLEQLQLKYGEAYRIKLRYEPSRILTPNDEIIYANNIHKIQGIRNDNEAAKRFVIITTSIGNSQSNTQTVTTQKEYHYVATGGETDFQDDTLKSWSGIILFFRDKSQFRVIRTGTPNTQQVLYDAAAGSFEFNTSIIPMAPQETADVYLI